MWAVITLRTPAAIAAWNGGSSRRHNSSRVASTMGSPKWESCSVAPWPGKCLAQAETPANCSPVTAAAAWAATRSGSVPKLRVPIVGLSSELLTSTAGAMSSVIPTSASSCPIEAYRRRVSWTSSTTPRAALPGYGLPWAYQSRVTSPPSSSMAMMTSWRAARREAVSVATWWRGLDVGAEEGDAAHALGDQAQSPGRRRRAGEGRKQGA